MKDSDILVGYAAIGERFGAGYKQLRKWRREGAPIVGDDRGVVRAQAGELWAWLKQRYGEAGTSHA